MGASRFTSNPSTDGTPGGAAWLKGRFDLGGTRGTVRGLTKRGFDEAGSSALISDEASLVDEFDADVPIELAPLCN